MTLRGTSDEKVIFIDTPGLGENVEQEDFDAFLEELKSIENVGLCLIVFKKGSDISHSLVKLVDHYQ